MRMPGSSRDAALHNQLYRYAEDLQQMVERHGELEAHCQTLQKSCARLTESREELDEVMRRSHDIHLITDITGCILQSNPAAAALTSSHMLQGSALPDWILPSHHEAFNGLRLNAIDGRVAPDQGQELYLRRAARNASPLIALAEVLAVRQENEVRFLHWILRDVTHLRETEFETQISSMVFKSAAEGVMITDVEGEVLAVNPAFTQITGYSAEEIIGRTPRILNSGIQDAAFYAAFWRSLRANGSWQGELYNRKKSGEIYPEWLTVSAARDGAGRILSYIAVFSDLSNLLREEKRLAHLAHFDTLTGLPNRLLFQERLAQMLGLSRRSGVPFTLIFIDLDKFKPINDTHGHATGDQVLKEAARRLAKAVREVDTVARLGGDEFVIIAPGLAGEGDIGDFCRKLLAALMQSMRVSENELTIGGSFGCAEYPRHGEDEATLLQHADVAMYRAKAAGGNTHVIYDGDVVTLVAPAGTA